MNMDYNRKIDERVLIKDYKEKNLVIDDKIQSLIVTIDESN